MFVCSTIIYLYLLDLSVIDVCYGIRQMLSHSLWWSVGVPEQLYDIHEKDLDWCKQACETMFCSRHMVSCVLYCCGHGLVVVVGLLCFCVSVFFMRYIALANVYSQDLKQKVTLQVRLAIGSQVVTAVAHYSLLGFQLGFP